jgi:hypothetical protein
MDADIVVTEANLAADGCRIELQTTQKNGVDSGIQPLHQSVL